MAPEPSANAAEGDKLTKKNLVTDVARLRLCKLVNCRERLHEIDTLPTV